MSWSLNDYKNLISEPEINLSLSEFLKYYKRYPVIAITWPAWVGKSTFTKILSDYLNWIVYTELPDSNPFLSIIKNTKWKVNDITLWLNNQNYFLATDVAQITKWFIEAKVSPVIFDFALTQPFIFSDMNLSWNKLESFNGMFSEQFSSLPKPDLIIQVTASDDVIIERLAKRWKHIDDFVIKMTVKLNSYYKSWVIEEFYWEDRVKKVSNNEQLNPDDINKIVKWLVEEIRDKI